MPKLKQFVLKTDQSEVDAFFQSLTAAQLDVLNEIPSDIVRRVLDDLLHWEVLPTNQAGEKVVRFWIVGTAEAFLSAARRAWDKR